MNDHDIAAVATAVNQAKGWIAGDCGWESREEPFDVWWDDNAHRFDQESSLARLVSAARTLAQAAARRRQRPHGKANCPRCYGDPDCRFCGGTGAVDDASCWTTPHPEHSAATTEGADT